MHETYCGKSCADCTEREELNCPGCRLGPGRAGSGDCGISRCSVSKGHHACDFCTNKGTCRNLRSCVNASQQRLSRKRLEQDHHTRQLKKVQLLGKWLWVMFWLVIASNVISFVFDNTLTAPYPAIRIIGTVASFVISAIYSFILCNLAEASEDYRYGGILGFVCLGLSVLTKFVPDLIATILSAVVIVLAYFRECRECTGHSDCVGKSDDVLSEKWCNLCYWLLGGQGVMFIGLLLSIFGGGLGAALALIGAVVLLIASVLKLVYLQKTMVLFKNYLKNIENNT